MLTSTKTLVNKEIPVRFGETSLNGSVPMTGAGRNAPDTNTDAKRQARDIRIRAEKKAGQMLAEREKPTSFLLRRLIRHSKLYPILVLLVTNPPNGRNLLLFQKINLNLFCLTTAR